MPLSIVRSPRAKRDAIGIWNYVSAESRTGAERLLRRIDTVVKMLSRNPQAGRRTEWSEDLRLFPFENYLIFYRSTRETLFIVRILHAARDVTPDLLSE